MTVSAQMPLAQVNASYSGAYKADTTKTKGQTDVQPINFKSDRQGVVNTEKVSPLTPKEQLVLSISKDKLGEYLDVEIKNGMLRITANNKKASSIFKDVGDDRRMSTIKESLGLKDGTIGKYNPEVYDRTSEGIQRGYGSTPDDGILAQGYYIEIPVSSVGESPNIFQRLFGTFDDLKK